MIVNATPSDFCDICQDIDFWYSSGAESKLCHGIEGEFCVSILEMIYNKQGIIIYEKDCCVSICTKRGYIIFFLINPHLSDKDWMNKAKELFIRLYEESCAKGIRVFNGKVDSVNSFPFSFWKIVLKFSDFDIADNGEVSIPMKRIHKIIENVRNTNF